MDSSWPGLYEMLASDIRNLRPYRIKYTSKHLRIYGNVSGPFDLNQEIQIALGSGD